MVSTYAQVIDAVYDAIVAIDLVGIDSGNIVQMLLPSDREMNVEALPAVVVSLTPGPITDEGGTTEHDDWGIPVLVTVIDAANQNLKIQPYHLLWEEQLRKTFHHQRLSGITANMVCRVESPTLIDLTLFIEKNLVVASLIVRAITRETRTVP